VTAHRLGSLEQQCRDGAIALISTDVFDTILLRNSKPEDLRFREVSAQQAAALRQHHGIDVAPASLHAARRLAAPIAYRTAPLREGERDGSATEIFRLMLTALRLPTGCVDTLLRAEVDYEAQNLRPNLPLLKWLSAWRSSGRRAVWFLSDMYLPKRGIEELIARLAGGWVFDGGEVSCEHSLTKRGGGLFRVLVQRTGRCPAEILHVGDDFASDVLPARAAGCRAVHLPRSASFLVMKALRGTLLPQ
jgi:FMN phosphatase YigB (HAD superfamily)